MSPPERQLKGFWWTPAEYRIEITRRYDVDLDQILRNNEAREWVYCFAPFLSLTTPGPLQMVRSGSVTSNSVTSGCTSVATTITNAVVNENVTNITTNKKSWLSTEFHQLQGNCVHLFNIYEIKFAR